MQNHASRPAYEKLTPRINAIVSDFQERHDLAELIALHAQLAEACGGDTLLNIACDQSGCHLHVTTFGVCRQPH
jgi:hypothetical protein